MIYYCILPVEEIMAELDSYEPVFNEVTNGNMIIQAEQGCIRRVFSTDPDHYLQPDLQPGQRAPEF